MQADPDGTGVSTPGRTLLQNGEPAYVFIDELRDCRHLRSGKQKRCRALVGCTP